MQLGVVGLGTMGGSLARNAARNGVKVAVFNRTSEKMDEFLRLHGSEGELVPCRTLAELVSALTPPRAVMLMVNAGPAVDAIIVELKGLLAPGDIIIDGGNSHFRDSQRREEELAAKGWRFLGMGISGGERGALLGPSMMPGGSREAFDSLAPLLQNMAAKDGSGGTCVAYIGHGGAGHFVKMVHNGIEYALLQLIAEAYHLLKNICGLTNPQLAELFGLWNRGRDLKSFLLEITANIFTVKDPDTGSDLVDVILDKAGQKGTGMWATTAAMDVGVAVPTITAAVDARLLSSEKEQRVAASALRGRRERASPTLSPRAIRSSLLLSVICAYAQGMALIRAMSRQENWNVNMAEICRIWRGGCIIRSSLLKEFQRAFSEHPQMPNLLSDGRIVEQWRKKQTAWRRVVACGMRAGVPLPAMAASLSYFDASFAERLPQNLIQAQRDFFGAHTYQRTDKPGVFHTEWEGQVKHGGEP